MIKGAEQMHGQLETAIMAAAVERELELARVAQLQRMGWPPRGKPSWLATMRRTIAAWRTHRANEPRPARRRGEREEAVARSI
jgi:hypothetical protein